MTRQRSSRACRRPATRAARSPSARATGRATPPPTTPPQGPTEDGRLKPDVVAPASTAVWPGIAMVGTSASAPHAAGAAALLMQRDRAAGQPSDPDTIARELVASALDIAPPGPDEVTGAGRIRLDLDAPTWVSTTPCRRSARGRHRAFRHRGRRRGHARGLRRLDRRRRRRPRCPAPCTCASTRARSRRPAHRAVLGARHGRQPLGAAGRVRPRRHAAHRRALARRPRARRHGHRRRVAHAAA